MVACHDWEAEHLDVVTAFLEAPVEEKIHMMLPDGFKKLRLQWWRARVLAKLLGIVWSQSSTSQLILDHHEVLGGLWFHTTQGGSGHLRA